MIIAAQALNKAFNKRMVLDNINLGILKGERVVFVGHNGSGKTTFIRCLLGLYNYSGVLRVDGINPRKNRIDVLKRVGYVPQTPPPINMKVKDLIEHSAHISGKPVGPIIEAVKTFKLDKAEDFGKNFMKLSGGMKQKLLIAIAVGRGNDIIIMDEPTSNLDPDSRKILYELLAGYANDVTFILTSHRADEMGFFANRTIEMDYGKVTRDSYAEP